MKTTPKNSPLNMEAITAIRRDPPYIMDVHMVSIFLGQSERTTRDDIRLNRIPHLRLGGRVLVRRSDLEQALAARVIGR